MPKRLTPEVQEKLQDKHWLITHHVDQCLSISEISKLLHITPACVTKALRLHNITSPSKQVLRESSNLRKYGVTNPGAVKQFHDKAKQTIKENKITHKL
jgi:hypothetical protein